MASPSMQRRAMLVLCLILSTIGPSEAERLHIHELAKKQHDDSSTKQHHGKWWGTIKCPAFLEANQTSKTCSYATGTTYKIHAASKYFTDVSNSKLLFNHTGQTFMTDMQFVSELSAAFLDQKAQYRVGASLAAAEYKKNKTFAALVDAHRATSDQNAHEHSGFHSLEENLKPGFFVVEHALEHAVVEGIEVFFHAVAHAADHGVVFGEAFLASVGIELAEVAGVTAGAAAFLLEWVFPILLPIQAGVMIWQIRSHFKEQTHHSKDFSSHLVMKSNCMIQKIQSFGIGIDLGAKKIHPTVGEVCGDDFAADFKTQVKNTMRAKETVFTTLATLGRCLYPHGERSWSKISCVETIYYKLLQSDGNAGILYGALTFLAYYGFRMDEIMSSPFFERWYETEFGIERTTNEVSMLPQLEAKKDLDVGARWPVCMQLMSSHRAFERTFYRLDAAIKVWMRSFGRDAKGVSIRTSWWPCQKVFFSLADISPQGFCKHFDWQIGHGKDEQAFDESQACAQAEEYRGSLWPETEQHDDDEKKKNKH